MFSVLSLPSAHVQWMPDPYYYVFRINIVDIIVALISVASLVLKELKQSQRIPINPSIFRVLRLFRLVQSKKSNMKTSFKPLLLDTNCVQTASPESSCVFCSVARLSIIKDLVSLITKTLCEVKHTLCWSVELVWKTKKPKTDKKCIKLKKCLKKYYNFIMFLDVTSSLFPDSKPHSADCTVLLHLCCDWSGTLWQYRSVPLLA